MRPRMFIVLASLSAFGCHHDKKPDPPVETTSALISAPAPQPAPTVYVQMPAPSPPPSITISYFLPLAAPTSVNETNVAVPPTVATEQTEQAQAAPGGAGYVTTAPNVNGGANPSTVTPPAIDESPLLSGTTSSAPGAPIMPPSAAAAAPNAPITPPIPSAVVPPTAEARYGGGGVAPNPAMPLGYTNPGTGGYTGVGGGGAGHTGIGAGEGFTGIGAGDGYTGIGAGGMSMDVDTSEDPNK